ncbi:MAG: hypothetical protein RRB12_10830, partial [Armatimonadota bacterium]|nr:hypothetical protein [Armatimonadota bacterium]
AISDWQMLEWLLATTKKQPRRKSNRDRKAATTATTGKRPRQKRAATKKGDEPHSRRVGWDAISFAAVRTAWTILW